jgi:hypothetical protein
MDDDDYDKAMKAIIPPDGQSLYAPTGRLKRQTTDRAKIIQLFTDSFEMIGGVPRLAIWADANPGDFFKLFGRLLPASSSQELDGPQEIIIRHAIPTQDLQQAKPDNERNSPRLPAETNILPLSPKTPAMGDRSGAPPGREDSGDD